MVRFHVAATLLLLHAAAVRPAAQTAGTIEGTVQDPDGRVVAAASLRVVEVATSAERGLNTDDRGWYVAPGLAPGTYQIEVSHPGFRSVVRRGVNVAAGSSARVDFFLELGERWEAVEVVAEAPLVNTNSSDWGSSVGRQSLELLPLNGRDLFDLAAQEPGTTVPASARKAMTLGLGTHISVNGARPNQNGFRMDGIYINDATSSAPASAAQRLIGVEGITELRLVTSPFSAEYGRAAGSLLTAVSKSGSNQLHGSFYEFFRNSSLDARNFFDAPDDPIPPLRKNQFGALLSGPLRRDALFLLGNYEGIRERASKTERLVTLTRQAREGQLPGQLIPVAPAVRPYLALYPLPNGRDFRDGTAEFVTESARSIREDYGAVKLDVVLSERIRCSARYTIDDTELPFSDPFRVWRFLDDSRYQFLHTQTQYIQSSRTIHAFRAGFSRVRNSETSQPSDKITPARSFVKGQPLGAIQVVGLSNMGGIDLQSRPRRYVVNDFQFNYDLVHIRGGHTIRLGTGHDRIHYNQRADFNAGGYYRFTSVPNFLCGCPASGDLMVPGSDSIRGWRQHQFFAFVQEEFRSHHGFSMTLGLRYEPYSTPTEVNGKVATLREPARDATVTMGGPLFENPSKKNFAPRVSVAWAPPGTSGTVIRAGAGLFYDLLGTRELIVAGVRTPPFFNRLAPFSPEFPDLLSAAEKVSPRNSVDGFEFYADQPRVLQFQFAIQRQLRSGVVAQIGFAGARGIHLVGQLGNINPPRPEILPDGKLFFPAEAPRVNPAFGQIGMRRTQFNSFYHAFLAGVQRRWRGGFHVQTKYVWSKSIDDASSVVFGDFANGDQVPTMFNYRQNRGPSNFDIRHVFAANFSYDFPRLGGTKMGWLLGGWGIHGLVQAQTGNAFAPRVGFDRARLRAGYGDLGQRPDFIAAPGARVILGDPQMYFDPSAFDLPAAGTYGNLGRGALSGPGLAVLDLALQKLLWQKERHSLRVRVEAFNLTNHPNFQLPSGLALFGSNLQRVRSAGWITETTTPSRQIQLAAKWVF